VEQSTLDKPADRFLQLDWEKSLYIIFIILALTTRLWALGERVQSHDESIHTLYSWNLYVGKGFSHHPLMHGPFLFHITALSYFLFGDNDFAARVPVALMGVAIVAFPYLLRRWLGRKGALVTSFFLLISPSISYYSRYIRHDTPEMLWALVVIFSFLSYLRDGRRRWLFLMAAGVSLMFATKEVAFIYTAIFGLFLVGLSVVQILKPKWPNENLKIWFLVTLVVIVVGLLLVGMGQAFQPPVPEDGTTAEMPDVSPVPETRDTMSPWNIVKAGGGLLAGAGLLAAVGFLLAGTLEQSDIEFAGPWAFSLLAIMAVGLFILGTNDWLSILFSKLVLPQPQSALLAIWGRVAMWIVLFAVGFFALFGYLTRRRTNTQQLLIAASITVIVATGVLIRMGVPLLLSSTTCSQQPSRWECIQQSLQEFAWPGGGTYILGILIDTRFMLTALPFIGGVLVGLAWLAVTAFRGNRTFDLTVLLGSLALPFLSPLLMILAGLKPMDYNSPAIYYTGAILIQVLLISIAIGLMWDLRQQKDGKPKNSWLIAAAIHYAIYVVLFTTFLTNAYGLASGFVGSLGYWLEQQEVERGSQPGYYYVIMTSLYEFLPLLLSLIASIYLAVRGLLLPRLQPKIKRLTEFPAVKEYLIPFVLWWVALSWIGYSVAGERMPWLTVHLALPMIVFSGWLVGRLIEEINWQRVCQSKAWLLALLVPPFVIALVVLVDALIDNPFQGHSLTQLQASGRFVNALIGLLACGACLGYVIWRSGWRISARILLLIGLLVSMLTLHQASVKPWKRSKRSRNVTVAVRTPSTSLMGPTLLPCFTGNCVTTLPAIPLGKTPRVINWMPPSSSPEAPSGRPSSATSTIGTFIGPIITSGGPCRIIGICIALRRTWKPAGNTSIGTASNMPSPIPICARPCGISGTTAISRATTKRPAKHTRLTNGHCWESSGFTSAATSPNRCGICLPKPARPSPRPILTPRAGGTLPHDK
jgi:predicted membrane-bound mannosyltransferase